MKLSTKKIVAILLTAAIMTSLFITVPVGAVMEVPYEILQSHTATNLQLGENGVNPATPNGITVNAQPTTGGTAVSSPTESPPGEFVYLSANPAAGYTFLRWETYPAGLVIFDSANEIQTRFTMPHTAVTIVAVFQPGTGRNLVVNVGPTSGSGAAGGRAGAGRDAAAATAAANAAAANSGGRLDNAIAVSHIHAIAAAGQTFSRWVNVAGGGTIANPASPTTTFTLPGTGTGDITIRAEFGPTRTVTIQRNNNAWGTATADQTSSAQHRRVALTASPASGFSFLHWEIVGTPPTGFNNDSIANRTSATNAYFTMPNANVTIRAVFQAGNQGVTVTTNNITGANATASAPNVSQGTSIVVTANQTVTLSATPPSGHALANWEVIGTPPSGFSNASFANRFEQSTTFTMPTGSVQIRANFASGNRVQVQTNNAALGTAVQSTGAATNGTNVTITATPTSGNRFVRWEAVTPSTISFANPDNATTTFTMPNSAVTVRAVFESGSQTIPAGGGVTVNYTISGGNVTLQLPTSKVNEIINATASGGVASLNMSGVSAAVSATFPREALTQLANANRGLELRFPGGTVSFNRDAASSVALAASAAITVSINTVAHGSLNSAQRDVTTVNDRIFRVSITSAGQTISSIGGLVSVTVTYTGALPVAAWSLTDGGILEPISVSHNATARTVTLSSDRLALFVVGQERGTVVSTDNPFDDVREGQWFFDNVMFVHGAGLMGGTSTNPPLFSPNMNLNRAMIVTILHRQEGEPTPTGVNPFSDVPSGQWFTDAVIWAAENDIVAGYAGRFNPLANITRQDLAVILMRYADFRGLSLPNVNSYTGFNDSNRISGYAVEAVHRSVEAGIITGRAGNIFAPLDNSTRAEAAAMLHRFFTAG